MLDYYDMAGSMGRPFLYLYFEVCNLNPPYIMRHDGMYLVCNMCVYVCMYYLYACMVRVHSMHVICTCFVCMCGILYQVPGMYLVRILYMYRTWHACILLLLGRRGRFVFRPFFHCVGLGLFLAGLAC